MGNINILDKHIAELIAAGEVIERPSSAIKELIENSIDAGACNITVEIKNGGTTYMKVSDDGMGIRRDDIQKAFLRHATSKVSNKDDLEKISTLGFRGEALASITAVSKIEVFTRIEEDIAGTHYKIEGSEEELIEDTGCAKGTTLIVRDLFYNIPARMKFLKKDVSEANSIAAVVDRIALSHPEISFIFIRDTKEELNTPGNKDIKTAIYSVYGKDFCNTLIPINYSLAGVTVRGFVSSPNTSRANRSMQHFFVNGRYVKSKTAMVALEQAYKGSIMVGKFPACVMYIDIPCEVTDVNVHPAKIEIRFIDEKPVFNAIYFGVKSAISSNEKPINFSFNKTITHEKNIKSQINNNEINLLDKVDISKNKDQINNENEKILWNEDDMPEITIPIKSHRVSFLDQFEVKDKLLKKDKTICLDETTLNVSNKNETKKIQETTQQEKLETVSLLSNQNILENNEVLNKDPIEYKIEIEIENEKEKLKFIGEAFSTYIILESNVNEIVLIDKHAAHEKIIYEKIKNKNKNISAQMLLTPLTIKLDKNEYAVILQNIDMLLNVGFEMEDFGSGTILVRTAPIYLEKEDVGNSISEIAGYISQNKNDLNTGYLDWVYHNIACRAAIKAGDKQKNEELIELVKELKENPEMKHCPHGRPIYIILTKKEIEKQFGRM